MNLFGYKIDHPQAVCVFAALELTTYQLLFLSFRLGIEAFTVFAGSSHGSQCPRRLHAAIHIRVTASLSIATPLLCHPVAV